MPNERESIENKVGKLRLAEWRGSGTDACKVFGYSSEKATIASKKTEIGGVRSVCLRDDLSEGD